MESEIKEILFSIYECLEIVYSLIIRIQEKKDNINKSIDLVEKIMIELNSQTHTNMKKKELNKQIFLRLPPFFYSAENKLEKTNQSVLLILKDQWG